MMAKKKKTSSAAEGVEAVESVLSRTEQFIEKNQNIIFYVVIGIVAIILMFMGYKRYILEPKQKEAQTLMFMAEKYFEIDSLNLALYGDGNNYGFVDIIDEYGRTDAGNLSCYYAGLCFLKKGEFDNAIEYLEDFDADDMIIGAMGKGVLGDAYMEIGDAEEALKNYLYAVEHNINDFTTPVFLMKAALTYEMLEDYKSALELYNRIKYEHPRSYESREIEKYIARAEGLME